MNRPTSVPGGAPRFATTSWTLIVDAGGPRTEQSERALATLVERYWHPLYAYLRRRGHDAPNAQDLTQAFFARFLEKTTVEDASQERGRFRTFLLTCLDHFVRNEWDKANAQKRGGGQLPVSIDLEAAEGRFAVEPAHERTPEREFERRWALTVLDRALARVEAGFDGEDRAEEFALMRPFLTGELPRGASTAAAEKLGKSPGAFKVAVHRLRRRYGEAVRAEIADTVSSAEEVDDEVQHLLRALRDDD